MGGITKRTLAAFTALLMLLLYIPSASASESGPAASITIHKLETDASRELSQLQSGDEIANPDDYIIYEGDSRIHLGDLKGINGISFHVTRVQDSLKDIEHAQPHTGEGAYSKIIVTQSRGRERGIAVFEDLPYGTYLIEEGTTADYDGDTMKFLVQVPMIAPQGDRLIYDIHIYPKNTLRSKLKKEVADFSPQTPTRVTWRFSWEIPAGIGDARQLVLTDRLDDRLSLQTGTAAVAVKYGDRSGSIHTLSKNHYEVDYDKEENIVTVAIDDSAAFNELSRAYLPEQGSKPPTLYIELTTNIAADARGTIYNSGELDYIDGVGEDLSIIPERDPSIYIGNTGGLLIYKCDGDTGKPLGGAEFKLFATREDAIANRNPIPSPRGGGTWPATGTDGYTLLDGIAYENEGTSYWLVETLAPVVTGSDPPLRYNLLPAPVEVVISASSHLKDNQVKVENRTGITLDELPDNIPAAGTARARVPDGGGGGTLPWRLGGLVLVAAGILVAYRYKRKNFRLF